MRLFKPKGKSYKSVVKKQLKTASFCKLNFPEPFLHYFNLRQQKIFSFFSFGAFGKVGSKYLYVHK